MINFDLSCRVAKSCGATYHMEFPLDEMLTLMRAVHKATSFEDLPEEYMTAIPITEKRLDDLARTS